MTLSRDMQVSQATLGILNALHTMGEDPKNDQILKDIIYAVIEENGMLPTVIGLTNLCRMVLFLRQEEVGISPLQTIEALGRALAKLEINEPTD